MADASDFPPRRVRLRRKNLEGEIGSIIVTAPETKPAAYVLMSADGHYLYKGSCRDLDKRLADHVAGRVSHTKNRRPLRLVYCEYFDSYTDARLRENWFKTGAGRDFIRAKIAESGAIKQ